ncbi:uncharacterized protein [Dermacentor albipictus]|uniref:uncharacterized protein n=1 Tax=Dermacentor albipictus TaxID=60249 RepID=UPI0038FC18D3
MARVVLNRLSGYIEDNEVDTYNMIGFRAELSTQDAMKLIKHQIVDGRSRDVKALLGLDLEKAFDNVFHTSSSRPFRTWVSVPDSITPYSSFLTDRKSQLRIGDFGSEDVLLGGQGTPQGAVISTSPTLAGNGGERNGSPQRLSAKLLQRRTTLSTSFAESQTDPDE